MSTTAPDIFGNVHKGIRSALFEACLLLGRAGTSPERLEHARARVREVLRFVVHHGQNEDILLGPLLATRATGCHERMTAAHRAIEAHLEAVREKLDHASSEVLYDELCALTTVYLAHMREEERELRPVIEAVLSVGELEAFGREAVARTAPADQRMMLAFMVPALPRDVAETILGKLPDALQRELRLLTGGQPCP